MAHISPWRTRAHGQRSAPIQRSTQLHSTPCNCTWGHARCKARRPWPKPQPASSTHAPAGKGSTWASPSKAPAGAGNTGASRQAVKGETNSHPQAGKLPAANTAHDNGNPSANSARRHQVAPHRLAPILNTTAQPAAAHQGSQRCPPTNTNQAPPQTSSAGTGKTNDTNP